jgi:rubrerythrin
MNLRKAAILKLTSQAQELQAGTVRGRLARNAEGHWSIDNTVLEDWLKQFEGRELVLIAGLLDDERPADVHTCNRCGREYTDPECPHCAEVRQRLRPRWQK